MSDILVWLFFCKRFLGVCVTHIIVIVTSHQKISKLKLTIVSSLKRDIFVNVDDAERYHASVRELKKKNTSLTDENTRFEVLIQLLLFYCDGTFHGQCSQ